MWDGQREERPMHKQQLDYTFTVAARGFVAPWENAGFAAPPPDSGFDHTSFPSHAVKYYPCQLHPLPPPVGTEGEGKVSFT